jgi:Flp pilus assembly CpaF family ATPase
MALMSDVDLPVAHVREQVASAIDVVVHMARLRDGRRVVQHVATVEGVEALLSSGPRRIRRRAPETNHVPVVCGSEAVDSCRS